MTEEEHAIIDASYETSINGIFILKKIYLQNQNENDKDSILRRLNCIKCSLDGAYKLLNNEKKSTINRNKD